MPSQVNEQHSNLSRRIPSSKKLCGKKTKRIEFESLDEVVGWNDMGILHLEAGRNIEAKRSFDKAVSKLNTQILERLTEEHSRESSKSKSQVDPSLYIYQREDYDEGLHVYQKALYITCTMVKDVQLATLFYNIGHTFIGVRQYHEAKMWFQNAKEILEASHDCHRNNNSASSSSSINDGVSLVEVEHNLGHCYYRLGENVKSLEHYQNALTQVTVTNRGKLDLVHAYNCIAVLNFHITPTESEKPLHLLWSSVITYNAIVGPCTKYVATLLSNIGRIHYMRMDFKCALGFFEEALSIREKVLDSCSVDVATAAFNVGQSYHKLGQLDLAMTFYERFLGIAEKKLGRDHRDFALALKSIAELYRVTGNIPKARKLFERALESERKALGKFHPEVALTLNDLGSMCFEEEGEVDEALRHFQECIAIHKRQQKPTASHYFVALLNLAQVYKRKADFRAAFTCYQDVLTLQKDLFGPCSLEVARTLSQMGLMKYMVKEFNASCTLYQEALLVRREFFGAHKLPKSNKGSNKTGITDDRSSNSSTNSTTTDGNSTSNTDDDDEDRDCHPDIASTLNSLGLVLFQMQLYQMAQEVFTECLRIRQKILGKYHRDVAVLWYNLATVSMELGRDEEGLRLYKLSLEVERKALGDEHPDVRMSLQHLGQIYQERGDFESAIEYFQQALRSGRKSLDKGSTSRLLNLIGNIHLMCGNTPKMMECFSEACRDGGIDFLIIAGHNFYGFSKSHPPCAAMA